MPKTLRVINLKTSNYMKKLGILLFLFSAFIKVSGQEPTFRVKFSEPLSVFDFVEKLSATPPDNSFKKLFNSSKFNQEKYKTLLAEFDKLSIDYNYEYAEYPYGQKIEGSTEFLLKRNLINSRSIDDFRLRSIGIIPNVNLFTLAKILTEFEPVYQELIYQPGKEKFENQLTDSKLKIRYFRTTPKQAIGEFSSIKNLIASKNIASYFHVGLEVYRSS